MTIPGPGGSCREKGDGRWTPECYVLQSTFSPALREHSESRQLCLATTGSYSADYIPCILYRLAEAPIQVILYWVHHIPKNSLHYI